MKSDIVSSFLFKETLEETCNLAHSSSDCQRAIAPLQSLCRDYDRGSRGNGFEDHGFVWVDYKKISTIVGGNRNQNECGLRTPDVAVLDSKQPPQCKQGKVRFCPSFAMDYREWQDPFCQRQEAVNCASLLETSCKAQSSSCTRTPGSSSSTHTLKCVKADGSQATGCKDTWTKPQCPPAATTPSNPTPTPTACTPGKEETKGPNSIGDPCTVGKRTCLGNGTWSNWEYPTAPFADASCVNGALLYCGTGGQPSENGDHCECINNSGKIYLGIKWSGQNVNYHDLLMQQASQLLLVPNATWSDICGVTP